MQRRKEITKLGWRLSLENELFKLPIGLPQSLRGIQGKQVPLSEWAGESNRRVYGKPGLRASCWSACPCLWKKVPVLLASHHSFTLEWGLPQLRIDLSHEMMRWLKVKAWARMGQILLVLTWLVVHKNPDICQWLNSQNSDPGPCQVPTSGPLGPALLHSGAKELMLQRKGMLTLRQNWIRSHSTSRFLL